MPGFLEQAAPCPFNMTQIILPTIRFIIFKYHLDHSTHVIKDLWGLLLAKLKFSMAVLLPGYQITDFKT